MAGARSPQDRVVGTVGWLLLAALLAPLIVFVGVLGVRAGLWDWTVGYGLLTRQVAFWAAVLGVAAAVAALAVALKSPRRAGGLALVALLASAGALGLLMRHGQQVESAGPGWDVTTNSEDTPGFSPELNSLRRQAGAEGGSASAACPGLAPINAQVAPQVAGWALKQAGFTVRGFGVGRADGVREGVWFGFTHDAVVRIRPGRTDVRVSGRENRPDAGEACRLARKIVSELQVRP